MLRLLFDALIRNWVLTVAYTVDWIVVIAIAAAGAGLNFVQPSHRVFSVLDLSISYPIEPEVSISTVVLVAGLAPAIIILLIVALCVPGHSTKRYLKPTERYLLKAWELERGWAGLALALSVAFFVTQGSKQLFGKPRPNLLARCQPDLNNIASYTVAEYGQAFNPGWTLVDRSICTTTDLKSLDDGFRSFPSGHSSFSWAGLLYLTLYLCAKFRISFPHLPIQPQGFNGISGSQRTTAFELQQRPTPAAAEWTGERYTSSSVADPSNPSPVQYAVRNMAATPPNHLLILAGIPLAVAVYISSTRYTDYYHFGFDIIAGSLLGISTAWLGFYWCHLPVMRGHGWAWGARSRQRAFGIVVGSDGYVEHALNIETGTSLAV